MGLGRWLPLVRLMSVSSSKECGFRLRVALVRHGESMNNVHEAVSHAAYRANRSADPDLSPRGREQAVVLGRWLASAEKASSLGLHPVTELVVSPVRRTLLTMAPLARELGMRARVDCELFEAGGIYEANAEYTVFEGRGGMTRAEMQEAHPTYVLPEEVGVDGWYKGVTKESDDECRERAARVIQRVKERARTLRQDEQIVLVVHYDFINACLDALLLPHAKGPFDRWKVYNTAITVVDLDANGEPSIVAFNAIPHILHADNASLVSGFPL
ncbi:hypothetical protein CTAYLR_010232 [Chrysophaeum taylorii]|uniref:Phosphoglycerate mutase n=1 Tax=Chrysophaeum taylorii TaxID=2483200 RepID=A0AAD7U6U2_9STRA|nr:hypothetical protein CTAYLR_010232 [Chrysophaeum taylorii]